MTEQCKQDVLSASILLQQRRDIKGGRPLLPPQYAGMAELADALDLGSSGQPCGFESHYPYHTEASLDSKSKLASAAHLIRI